MKKYYRNFNLITLSIILISISLTSYASTTIPEKIVKNKLCYQFHCPTGTPKNNFIVDHKIYILSSNRKTKFSDWVAYIVDGANMRGPRRRRVWRRDPNIPAAYTLSPRDYRRAHAACGYDRGHQVPLGDFSNNRYWARTNYLSNITPQMASLNQGPWNRLEIAISRFARRNHKSSVYVVTGPIYGEKNKMCPLPARPNLKIPTAYFKIIFQSGNNVIHYAAFIMPQAAGRRKNICIYAVNLRAVRDQTGLHFLKNPSMHKDQSLLKKLGC